MFVKDIFLIKKNHLPLMVLIPIFMWFFHFMLQITVTCICYMWCQPLIFAGVYISHDTGWEASKVSKVHTQFQGFYDLTFSGLYYANTMFVKCFSCRTYVATYHWLYWFLFFCDFFLRMSWNTCICMCCMWHVPLVITGVYNSCEVSTIHVILAERLQRHPKIMFLKKVHTT